MNKTTYARRKAQGRCAYCGGQPPQRGFVGCRACVTGNRQAAWARRDAQRPRGLRLPAPVPDEPEVPEEEDQPQPETEPEPVAAETVPAMLPDFTQDMDIREAISELAPHVFNRWIAEDALGIAENPHATREQLQAQLTTLQRSIDNQRTEGAPDDDPTLL